MNSEQYVFPVVEPMAELTLPIGWTSYRAAGVHDGGSYWAKGELRYDGEMRYCVLAFGQSSELAAVERVKVLALASIVDWTARAKI